MPVPTPVLVACSVRSGIAALNCVAAERLVAMGARIHSHAMLPLAGTPTRDAVPERIEDDVAAGLARLEARGAAWGRWRRQVVAAERLVRRRAGEAR